MPTIGLRSTSGESRKQFQYQIEVDAGLLTAEFPAIDHGTAIHPRAGYFQLRTIELMRIAGIEDRVIE